MRRLAILLAIGMTASACGQKEKTPSVRPAEAVGEEQFPKRGMYHIIRDRFESGHQVREETDMSVDASYRVAFEELVAGPDGTNCRDRQVAIGDGHFRVRMTCDAHDGDIHNIGIEREGSYAADRIDMTIVTTLWGMPIRENRSYRLNKT